MIIDPKNCTNFDRTDEELQAFAIFAIMVANKNADRTSKIVNRFLSKRAQGQLPFDYIREMGNGLHNTLVAHRVGQYRRIEQALLGIAELDVRTCTLEDLLAVHGVGPKTARYFLLHTRRDADYAVLDTHILKFMRRHGVIEDTQGMPSSQREYERLEQLYLTLRSWIAPNMVPADFDLLVWTAESGRLDGDHPFPALPAVPGPVEVAV